MSDGINFYGIERISGPRLLGDSDQYHPRYTRSEWDYYRRLERKNARMACFWLCFALACAVGIAYVVTR